MSDERADPMGKRFDEVPTDQLFVELELPETDAEEYWERVRCLHTRGGRDVFEFALAALNGPDGLRRRAGADVLSQLGYRDDKPFEDETIPHLIARLSDSRNDDALVGIAGALGHLGYGENIETRRTALPRLSELSHHEDEDVRDAVVAAVKGAVYGPDEVSIEAVRLLCELTNDTARDVRDWATFWLENLPDYDIDLPEVRAALWARVRDEDQEIRVQAINGLAKHGDRDVLPHLMEELTSELVDDDSPQWLDAFEAAQQLPDPMLLPVLRRLERIIPEEPWLSECRKAIVACEAVSPAR